MTRAIAARTSAIAMTSGADLHIDEIWATAEIATMTQARTSVAVRAHTKNRNLIRAIVTRGAGTTASAATIRVTSSPATWTCREDANARSCTIVIASTRCAVQNRERSRLSARFEWSPVVIS